MSNDFETRLQDVMASAGGAALEREEHDAEARGDYNTAVAVEAYLGALLRHERPSEAFDEEVTHCPACGSREADYNAIEAWCEDCTWNIAATDAPFLHSLVYEAHLRRRERIGKLLHAAGVLPEPHTDE